MTTATKASVLDELLDAAMEMTQAGETLQGAARRLAEEMNADMAMALWRRYGADIIYRLLLQRAHARRAATYGEPRVQPPQRAEWAQERAQHILELPVCYLDERGRRRIIAFGDMTEREVQGAVDSHLDYAGAHHQAAMRFQRFLPFLQGGRRVRDLPPDLVVALWQGEDLPE